jgi:hypothetical protein
MRGILLPKSLLQKDLTANRLSNSRDLRIDIPASIREEVPSRKVRLHTEDQSEQRIPADTPYVSKVFHGHTGLFWHILRSYV